LIFATGARLCFSQDLCPAPKDFSAALNSFPAPDQEQLRHVRFCSKGAPPGIFYFIFSAAGSKPRFSLSCAAPKVPDLACRSGFRCQRPLISVSLVTSSPSALLSFFARFWFDPNQPAALCADRPPRIRSKRQGSAFHAVESICSTRLALV
jgi:hypothetical protein